MCTKFIHSTVSSSRTATRIRNNSQHSVTNSRRSSGSLSLTLGLCWGFGMGNGHIPTDPTPQKKAGLRRQPSAIFPVGFFWCMTLLSRPSKRLLFMVALQIVWDPGSLKQFFTAPHLIKPSNQACGNFRWVRKLRNYNHKLTGSKTMHIIQGWISGLGICRGLTLAQCQVLTKAVCSPCPATAGQRRKKNQTKGSRVQDGEKTLQRQNRLNLKL